MSKKENKKIDEKERKENVEVAVRERTASASFPPPLSIIVESPIERFAMRATTAIGSPASLLVHTVLFIMSFGAHAFGYSYSDIMIAVTTAVSFEAIYLSLFIQMSVNRQARQIEEVSEDIETIQEDIDEIQEDVEEIQEDVDEIQEDVGEIQEDVEGIQEDTKELSEDIEEIKEDVEEMSDEMEKEEKEDKVERTEDQKKMKSIEDKLEVLLLELKSLRESKK